ncbi:hypothetical protein C8R48DRAFT_670879 [Suillus tomentosus]|nr:hypothetical protein C8R48DRAFT_670879 [Suillus tomentosus]
MFLPGTWSSPPDGINLTTSLSYPSVNNIAAGCLKDTATNLKNNQGFAMNIISEAFVENANATAIDAPPEFDEWALNDQTKEKCNLYSLNDVVSYNMRGILLGLTAAAPTTASSNTTNKFSLSKACLRDA